MMRTVPASAYAVVLFCTRRQMLRAQTTWNPSNGISTSLNLKHLLKSPKALLHISSRVTGGCSTESGACAGTFSTLSWLFSLHRRLEASADPCLISFKINAHVCYKFHLKDLSSSQRAIFVQEFSQETFQPSCSALVQVIPSVASKGNITPDCFSTVPFTRFSSAIWPTT